MYACSSDRRCSVLIFMIIVIFPPVHLCARTNISPLFRYVELRTDLAGVVDPGQIIACIRNDGCGRAVSIVQVFRGRRPPSSCRCTRLWKQVHRIFESDACPKVIIESVCALMNFNFYRRDVPMVHEGLGARMMHCQSPGLRYNETWIVTYCVTARAVWPSAVG